MRWLKRVPVELQSLRSECGLACLAMVLGYHGGDADLATLRRRFPGFNQGLSLKDLVGLAERMGYVGRGVRTEPDQLQQLQLPAILHWQLDHFVVLVRVTKRGCLLHDPAQGRRWCPWSELDRAFTGVALEMWPSESQTTEPDAVRWVSGGDTSTMSYAALWRFTFGVRRQLAWVMALSLVLQGMLLAAPWHVQWTVDEALVSGDVHLIGVLCLGFGLLLICRSLTHLLRGLMVLHLGHLLSFQLACRLLAHLLRLPVTWFSQRHVGDIASRFTSLQPIRDLLTQGAAAILVDGFMVILSLLLMLVYSPTLALLVAAIHIVFLLVYLGFVPRMKRMGMALVMAQAAEQSHLLQSVQSMQNIKVYTLESERTAQWQRLHSHTLTHSLDLQRQHLSLGTAGLFVGGAELIVLIYLMAHQVLAGDFTLGMLFAFLSYRGHFTERLRGLTDQLVNLRTLQVHLQRVGELWTETAEPLPRPAPEEKQLSTYTHLGGLTLQQVFFRHFDRQPWVLNNVDLQIAAGEFVAIVGASGCGKSTLLQLLMGLMPPTQGQVMWRGRALMDEDAIGLRRCSACVLQEDAFFSGSIAENLALFEIPDLDRVQSCLEQVDMAQTIAGLPLGLHTPVGDIGHGLSTGQMQRLLLARAIYQQPQILFLDEATANLDMASANTIQRLVLAMKCTRIAVTHDVKFAASADRMFELREGKLNRVALPPKNAAVPSAG